MKTRDIIDAAIEQIDTYRSPDIDEAQALINSILQAAKLGTTGGDKIAKMEFRSGHLNIETSYSVRCCDMSRDFHIPVEIINADDPIKAATRWAAEKELNEASKEEKHAENRLNLARERLQKALNAMNTLDSCQTVTV